jgi:hypothetical protein
MSIEDYVYLDNSGVEEGLQDFKKQFESGLVGEVQKHLLNVKTLFDKLLKAFLNVHISEYTVIPIFHQKKILQSDSKSRVDALALYQFYLMKSAESKTNQVWAQVHYCSEGLGIGRDRIRKARNLLKELGLIKDINTYDQNKKQKCKCYTKLNYKPTQDSYKKAVVKELNTQVKLVSDQPIVSKEMLNHISALNTYYSENCPGKCSSHKIPAPGEKVSKTILNLSTYIHQIYTGEFIRKQSIDKEFLESNEIETTKFDSVEQAVEALRKSIKRYFASIRNKPDMYINNSLSSFIFNYGSKKSTALLFMKTGNVWEGDAKTLRQLHKHFDEDELNLAEKYYDENFKDYKPTARDRVVFFSALRKLKKEYEKRSADLSKYNRQSHMRFADHCRCFEQFMERVFDFLNNNFSYKRIALLTWGKGDAWDEFQVYMKNEWSVLLDVSPEDIEYIHRLEEQSAREEVNNKINSIFEKKQWWRDEENLPYTNDDLWEQSVAEVESEKSKISA